MNKAVKKSVGQTIGDEGELILEQYLTKYCATNKVLHDYGEDFICSIKNLEHQITEKMFYVQCKGHESIDRSKEHYSETIRATTLLQWVKRKNLTFLFIVDTTTEEIFYVNPTSQINANLEKLQAQQSLSIQVPFKNKVDKQRGFPKAIISSIDNFDLELFDVNGPYIKKLEYLNTFTEKDWYSREDNPEIDDSEQSISIKYKNVHFFGFYWDPSEKLSGSCQINIARFKKMSKSSIELGPQELLNYFYFGRDTLPSFEYRKNYRKYIRVPLPEYEQYNIGFGNSTIYLYPNELAELNKVIDIFISRYTARLLKYNEQYNIFGYPPVNKNLNQIKLMTVSKNLWEEMLEYKEKYIVSNGEYEKGYCFEPFMGIIALATKENTTLTKFYITGKYKLSSYLKEPEVEIIWNAPDSLSYIKYDKSSWYSTHEAYDFLVKNIVMKIRTPYQQYKNKILYKQPIDNRIWFCSGENPQEKILLSNKKGYLLRANVIQEKFEEGLISENYSYKLEINNVYTIRDLICMFMKLSDFIRERGYLIKNEIKELKLFIEHIIRATGKIFTNLDSYSDASEKVYFERYFENYKKDINSLASRLKNALSEDEQSHIYAMLFKKFYNMLGDFEEHLDFKDFKNYLPYFSKIISLYNDEKLIKLLAD